MPYQAAAAAADDNDDSDSTTLHQPRVRYEGEDTSPTTPRELNGWLAYPIAAEVFAVVAVGKFAFPQYLRYDSGC
jgi:UMF1 family MFS transporter